MTEGTSEGFKMVIIMRNNMIKGLPRWLNGKESTCHAGDVGSIPGSGDPLEEEMVTQSSILAWRIPWTEKPDRLSPRGGKESATSN